MNSKRTYYLMIVSLVLLVGAILGGTYMATGMLKKQSEKLVDYKLLDQVLQQEQTGLIKAKADGKKYSSLEQIAKTIVPQDKDQARAVREIVKIATESGIKPTAINFPVSTLGNIPTGAAAGTATSGTGAPGTAAKQSLSQLSPVKGIPGVYNLPITIEVDATAVVPYAKFIEFLGRLEQNRRTAHVSSILIQPSPTNGDMVSFTLTVEGFIKP